jgi:hypothetical protein
MSSRIEKVAWLTTKIAASGNRRRNPHFIVPVRKAVTSKLVEIK